MSILQDLTQALNLAYTNEKYETVLEIAPEIILELSQTGLLTLKKDRMSAVDLQVTNRILEAICGASLLAESSDERSFSKYINLIKPSAENTELLWLHLISLLSQGDFIQHQQLSTYYHILVPNFEKAKYAAFGKNLEVFLNEGNYGGVLQSFQKESQIDKFILSFKPKFLALCRNEIGDNVERSYKNGLKLGAARTLLYFDTDLEVAAFAQERGWNVNSNGVIKFSEDSEGLQKPNADLFEDLDTVEVVIAYAEDIERVV